MSKAQTPQRIAQKEARSWQVGEIVNALTKNGKTSPPYMRRAFIVSITPSSLWIRYDESGKWFEELKEKDFWRLNPIDEEVPADWPEREFEPPNFFESIQSQDEKPPHKHQQQKNDSEDEWLRPLPKGEAKPRNKKTQKLPKNTAAPPDNNENPEGTPQKQAKITEFFSPGSPFSPSPTQTLNGRLLITNKQPRISQYFQSHLNTNTLSASTSSSSSSFASSTSISSSLASFPSSLSNPAHHLSSAGRSTNFSELHPSSPSSSSFSSASSYVSECHPSSNFVSPTENVSSSSSSSSNLSECHLSSSNVSSASLRTSERETSSAEKQSDWRRRTEYKTDNKSETKNETETESDSENETESDSGNETDGTESDSESETDSETNTESSGSETGLETDSERDEEREKRKGKDKDQKGKQKEEHTDKQKEKQKQKGEEKGTRPEKQKEKCQEAKCSERDLEREKRKRKDNDQQRQNEKQKGKQKERPLSKEKNNGAEDTKTLPPTSPSSSLPLLPLADPKTYPEYDKANFDPTAKWKASIMTLKDMQIQANEAFEKMRFWRKNIWKAPGGKLGKSLINEQTSLIESWNKKTNLELIAMTLNMIFLPLLLQKSGRNVKAKSVKEIVEQRLRKWNDGKISELVKEAEYLQDHTQNLTHNPRNSAQIFSRLMMQGKVKAALRVVSGSSGGTAKPSEDVLQKLQQKHPSAAPLDQSALLAGDFQKVPDSHWEVIDGPMIRSIALNMKGAGGWTGVDSDDLKPLLCSKNYGSASDNFCEAVAAMTKRLCRELVDPEALQSFLACRLVPLEKGENDVRPIGIGETLRRIAGKAAVRAIKSDIQQACGSIQVCAGLEAGCKAAVHAVRETFAQDDTEAALLIDASNAFNSANRRCTIQNIAILCPSFFIFLVNTYRVPIRLFIPAWKKEILSLEGTTQGDPAAMGMYALSVMPLIKELSQETLVQAWYADDGTGVGRIQRLKAWWDTIVALGPKYGYHPNARKTVLVVKAEHETKARQLFDGTGIEIMTGGVRHLGAALGDENFVHEYVKRKVSKWCSELETLASFATSEPHAAYAAYTFGFKGKWNFLQRTIPNTEKLFEPLQKVLTDIFIPKLTGHKHSQIEREILSLPARNGGLGISNPMETAPHAFDDSIKITKELRERIKNQSWFPPNINYMKEEKKKVIKKKRERDKKKLLHLKEKVKIPTQKPEDQPLLKMLESASAKGSSNWLTSLPLQDENRALNKGEFRDALALRYGWRPNNLPQRCACGASNTIAHCLDCKIGGYVSMRHNQTRNTFANLLQKAGCKDVMIEQQLLPVEGELDNIKGAEKGDEARMDVTALGFWGAWQRAFFDIRVFDPFAPSYAKRSISSLFQTHEREKKRKYGKRITEVEKSSFTPLIFTVSGGCGKECDVVLKKLAAMISEKTSNPHSVVMNWIRTEISFTLLRSCITCLRGWRKPKNSGKNISDTDFEITHHRTQGTTLD